MRLEHASETRVGLIRTRNEDSFLVLPDEHLYVVADGLGGDPGEDIASRTVVEAMSHFFQVTENHDHTVWPHVDTTVEEPHACRLASSLQYAHQCLLRAHRERGGTDAPAGTTVVALYFADSQAVVANLGDCRCYCYSRGKLRQLTRDHSMVTDMRRRCRLTPDEEKRLDSVGRVPTPALGTDPAHHVGVETRIVVPRPGDLFLLCSDGLHAEILDREIAGTLGDAGNLRQVCQGLVASAIERGGRDDATAVFVRFLDDAPSQCLPADAAVARELTSE